MGRGVLGFARVVHSIVPLAVLEAVKNLDTPVEDGLTEFAEELLVKRLGLSSTVAMQLAEFEQLVRKDARVDDGHVATRGTHRAPAVRPHHGAARGAGGPRRRPGA